MTNQHRAEIERKRREQEAEQRRQREEAELHQRLTVMWLLQQ